MVVLLWFGVDLILFCVVLVCLLVSVVGWLVVLVDFDCLRLICFSACVVLCLQFVWCV